ncbi:hypothetical protein F9K33_07905 [bacterium]|nr:MAG: hypothetical protein F9K33_07905 [bacterium]
MANSYFTLIIFSGILTCNSAIAESKSTQLNVQRPSSETHGLDSEQAEMLDKILHLETGPDDVMLEDGTTLSGAKRDHPEWFERDFLTPQKK